jgi:putative hydrolase of the HAD superfamily
MGNVMIKAVVFDFDGLIIDTEMTWYESFKEILEEYGVDLPLEEFAKYIGTHEAALYDYCESIVGGKITQAEMRKQAGAKHREKMKNPETREGVKEYLEEAKNLGLKIGLASSSTREWVESFLKALDIYHYFSVIRTREDVERVKPDPALYIKAVRALQVEPHETIAFEDSANGAKAAIDAGLKCVIVPNRLTESLVFEQHHLRISSMNEMSLENVIKSIES